MADSQVDNFLVERLRSPESWCFLSVSDGSSATSSQFKRCPNFCIQHIHTYKSDRKNQNPNLSLSITNHRSLMQCKPIKSIPPGIKKKNGRASCWLAQSYGLTGGRWPFQIRHGVGDWPFHWPGWSIRLSRSGLHGRSLVSYGNIDYHLGRSRSGGWQPQAFICYFWFRIDHVSPTTSCTRTNKSAAQIVGWCSTRTCRSAPPPPRQGRYTTTRD